MHRVKTFSTLVIAVVLLGCSSSPMEAVCTLEFRYGLVVYVNDSLTNTPVASGASLVVRDGSYKDSVAYPAASPDLNALPLASAGERAGTYQVTVTKPGNLPWSMNNVRVTANQCHVNQVKLTARLVPTT